MLNKGITVYMMVQLQTRLQPVKAQSADDSGVAVTKDKIAAIMDRYRARIEDINARSTDPTSAAPTAESNTRHSEIISESRLKLQKANTVVNSMENDVRKLEVYSKVLMMVRRSLTSAGRNYSYIVIKKQGRI